ncbi:hypothetical protein CU669_10980 [Paramagnetospirillum kuznetsovii]|uniref:Glycosyltransferase subfamily 4-like N-terminal domain-containing protein n=1 Tax=Paramagnetospirillum kuznetsovii TaxID=2053833 RepID=A0A364NXL4_9PROT|nr:glycosyltransferase [Paramagnetospirillum kuznetsovii]RAU21822.1 hypothetical protein CU669_10980 [Paramagnetospirillum kuznetsovii]
MTAPVLLVIIPDQLSALVAKGEVQPRYYNPGNLFGEVHILMTNADRPQEDAVRPMVGDAAMTIHNLPEDYRPLLEPNGIKRWRMFDAWSEPAVALARRLNPAVVRCHGTDFNTVAARRIKQALGIPYVVSLHTNLDQSPCRRRISIDPEQVQVNVAMEDLERRCLAEADLVVPVYGSILPYLDRLGGFNFEICYNVLNGATLRHKDNYALGSPVRLISVGRQYHEKNAENILRAVADLPEVTLTMVGDGPLHQSLKARAVELDIVDRIDFQPVVPNAVLCAMLAEFDLFVVHTEAWEFNKSVIEALLAGLPVIINRRIGRPVPELTEDIVTLVENTPDAYWRAIRCLMDDHATREAQGRQAYAISKKLWAPSVTEARYVEIYRRILDGRAAAAGNNQKQLI